MGLWRVELGGLVQLRSRRSVDALSEFAARGRRTRVPRAADMFPATGAQDLTWKVNQAEGGAADHDLRTAQPLSYEGVSRA